MYYVEIKPRQFGWGLCTGQLQVDHLGAPRAAAQRVGIRMLGWRNSNLRLFSMQPDETGAPRRKYFSWYCPLPALSVAGDL